MKQANKTDEPTHKLSPDGVYPRCVHCGNEIYGPAVIAYSLRKIPCASVNGCGEYLPEDYVKLENPDGE